MKQVGSLASTSRGMSLVLAGLCEPFFRLENPFGYPTATSCQTGNCQVAVSLHHVGEQGNTVLGWRLYLPESWTKDRERRQAAGVPEEVVFKKKWELALDLIDQVRDWGVPDRIVLGDAGYGEATEFRDALEERGLRYAVGIAPNVGAWIKPPKIKVPEYSGRGAPPKK